MAINFQNNYISSPIYSVNTGIGKGYSRIFPYKDFFHEFIDIFN